MKLIRSNVRKLSAYIPGEQPKSRRVVKLNTNENPYPPSPAVAKVLRSTRIEDLRLYPAPTSGALRAELARLHRCRPEQVFVGNGSDEVLALCVRAFVERNGAVGYFDPSYSLYPVLAAIEDVRTNPVSLPADFGWTMPRGYRANLFFLTNPNAPTSAQFPKSRVRSFCRSFRGVVVIDEAYVDFAPVHGVEFALSRSNVLVARTLSKSYSLAGIRLGYAIGDARLIAALDKIKDSYNVNRLTQDIALAALRDQRHMRKNVARIVATRKGAIRELRARGWWVADSRTNFIWARPPEGDARAYFERLRAMGILVRYFPGLRTGEHLRITVGTDEQMLKLFRALSRCAEA